MHLLGQSAPNTMASRGNFWNLHGLAVSGWMLDVFNPTWTSQEVSKRLVMGL